MSQKAEQSEGQPVLQVADPDDYHQAQRLKAIHQARRHVIKTFQGMESLAETDVREEQTGQLASAITAYLTETDELLQRSNVQLDLPETYAWDSVRQYMAWGGYDLQNHRFPINLYHMAVFRMANEAVAEMQPLVDEQENDSWEI